MCAYVGKREERIHSHIKNTLSLDINFNTQHYHMPLGVLVASDKKTNKNHFISLLWIFWTSTLGSALHKQVFVKMKVGDIITHNL